MAFAEWAIKKVPMFWMGGFILFQKMVVLKQWIWFLWKWLAKELWMKYHWIRLMTFFPWDQPVLTTNRYHVHVRDHRDTSTCSTPTRPSTNQNPNPNTCRPTRGKWSTHFVHGLRFVQTHAAPSDAVTPGQCEWTSVIFNTWPLWSPNCRNKPKTRHSFDRLRYFICLWLQKGRKWEEGLQKKVSSSKKITKHW